MKKFLFSALCILCLEFVSAQSISTPSTISYSNKSGQTGTYSLTYRDGLISSVKNNGKCTFGKFRGLSYTYSYPEPSIQKELIYNLNGQELGDYQFTTLSPGNVDLKIHLTDAALGSTKLRKDVTETDITVRAADRSLQDIKATATAKESDKGIKSITQTSFGLKFKTKIEYSDIMNYSLFDYMTFIANEFLGIHGGGFFDFWSCASVHPMRYYPKSIEDEGIKYIFDYTFPSKGLIIVEVKLTRNGKTEDRYTFKISE